MGLDSPLHEAARAGDVASIRALLAAGVDPCARTRSRETALHHAASAAVVEVLAAAGAEVDARSEFDRTPLDTAAEGGRLEVMRALFRAGADLERRTEGARLTPLLRLISSDAPSVAEARCLLELGADLHARDWAEMTALHHASQLVSGNRRGVLAPVVRFLVEAGIPVDARDSYGGQTPLHAAVGDEGTDLGAVEALLDLGADINARTTGETVAGAAAAPEAGLTPLMLAVDAYLATELVPLLLARGADPCLKDPDGWRALDYADDAVQTWQEIVARGPGDVPDPEERAARHREALTEAEAVRSLLEAATRGCS
jgi:hypothetical protein